jgi:Spore coat polysaccharide biosynthesis protein F, CMP-KDO synthetase homolog
MTVGIIVQTRTGSSRLPSKVMMKADEDSIMLDYVINQLNYSKLHDELVIATTVLEQDDVIFDHVTNRNIQCFRGDEKNVLERHYECAKKYSFSTIVRIPSDKPLIDPTIVDTVIEKFQSSSYDYISNFSVNVDNENKFFSSFPSGTEVEIFSFSALENAFKNANTAEQKEHVTPYIYENPEKFKIFTISSNKDLAKFRWALDYEKDLKLIRLIISKIKKRPILMSDILTLFENQPELTKIN